MAQLILATEAAAQSSYSESHIRWLVRTGRVTGEKLGRDWWVDLEDLRRYEREMEELGTKKYDPTRSEEEVEPPEGG